MRVLMSGGPAPVAVHGVQQLVHAPVHLRAWPHADRRSKIVFIVQGLERDVVERSLQVFMAITGSQQPVGLRMIRLQRRESGRYLADFSWHIPDMRVDIDSI